MFQDLITILLEPNYRRLLDFEIVFDDNQYWLVDCVFTKREETCEKFLHYPKNCGHYVGKVYYGMEIWVLFRKTEFLENLLDVRFMNYIFSVNFK